MSAIRAQVAEQSSAGPALGAVLFDMDGLLIDSEPLWFAVTAGLAAELGGTWTVADQAACLGGTIPATVARLRSLLARPGPPEQLQDALLAGMRDRLAAGVPLQPGAAALLDALRAAGVPLGLVSSSHRPLVDAVVSRLGGRWFDVTVAGDEVASGKPHPEPYRRAVHRLGLAPAGVVVLEDAPAGVAAAEAAGCVCVAVPGIAPVPATATRPVLASLTEVGVDWLAGLPAQVASVRARQGAGQRAG